MHTNTHTHTHTHTEKAEWQGIVRQYVFSLVLVGAS